MHSIKLELIINISDDNIKNFIDSLYNKSSDKNQFEDSIQLNKEDFKSDYENIQRDCDYLLSVAEVAKKLKTNKNFIYTLIKAGLLKTLKIGSYKIRNSELNRFMVNYEGKDLSDLNDIKDI